MAVTDTLGAYLFDFGTSVSFTGSTAGMKGIMDLTGQQVLADGDRAIVTAAERTVTIRTDQKGSLTQGSSITVNFASYVVRDLQPIDDGSFTMVWLRNG